MDNYDSLKQFHEETGRFIEQSGFRLRLSMPVYRWTGDIYTIGMAIKWNESARWWQPYFIFTCRFSEWQFGFLYEKET